MAGSCLDAPRDAFNTAATPSPLWLAPFAAGDAPALFDFMSDPQAMQHTWVAPSIEHCSARLGAYEALRPVLGFAPWVAREASSGRIVGWGGLCLDPDEPQWGVEVIYAFAPAAWGRGYATELVRASLLFAFGAQGLAEVHAFARPENSASVRVLAKCGFAFLRYEPELERDHFVIRSGLAP